MNIALDMSPVADKNRTGVANYIANLVHNISRIDDKNKYFLCYRLSRLRRKVFFLRVNENNFRNKIIQEPINIIFQLKIDIFHGMADRLPWSYRAKKVVTIHDIGSVILKEKFSSEHFRNGMLKRYKKMLTNKQADIVIAVSKFTKNEIISNFNYPEERIKVIHQGISKMFVAQNSEMIKIIKNKYKINRDYFIFVGAISLRKNISRLLKAYKIFSLKNKNVDLVLAGHLSYGNEEILEILRGLDLNKRVKLIDYVKNKDLPSLYSGARALVFPTLYEGFGLPVIEAMACGLPVITSNTSSLPEIAGDAASLVDPENIDEISENMLKINGDNRLREMLREKGLERAKYFSWDKTAKKTLNIYKDIYGS